MEWELDENVGEGLRNGQIGGYNRPWCGLQSWLTFDKAANIQFSSVFTVITVNMSLNQVFGCKRLSSWAERNQITEWHHKETIRYSRIGWLKMAPLRYEMTSRKVYKPLKMGYELHNGIGGLEVGKLSWVEEWTRDLDRHISAWCGGREVCPIWQGQALLFLCGFVCSKKATYFTPNIFFLGVLS